MDKLSYEDMPPTNNANLKSQFVIKGLSQNGVDKYLLDKNSLAYNFLPKPSYGNYGNFGKNQNQDSSVNKGGFFSTAIDLKSTKNTNNEFDKEQ